ncbi:hypothetical protein L228DRAFT_16400 [Xylona heveae TC161]|uniref:VWFA domain-containing protein n=1 Tax=Xylona heveae (strain CBS 132557 / TC161) TaxID=1328760 RepID=A0A165JUW3_XYLHT|nr:hypothetical protein L228DRAFT_16400 [Xylona heveae TC161]KZF26662.1 hypothetical protein L228DRAFT_16400 [Xylona heveae TC161]
MQPGQNQYQAYPGNAGAPQSYPPGQYPPQQSYRPPPGNAPYGGAYPPQSQAGPEQTAAYKRLLQATVQEKNLQNIYPPNSPILDQLASRVTTQVDHLCSAWRIPREVAQDIVKLSLFDIILYIDDSGSMVFEEKGSRIDDLKLILNRVAYAATLFDQDGVTVRFMNHNLVDDPRAPPERTGNNIRTEEEVERLVSGVHFKGLTPMGTSLRDKILRPLVLAKAETGQLTKPVLIITITDGQPAGEPQNMVFDVIREAADKLARLPRYGSGAIAFEFAQVGNDLKAREFLGKLDNEPGVGHLVDCTSNFEVEQDEMSRAQPPVDLTPELWLAKLLLGAVDSSYDTKDEATNRPSGAQAYGAPPYAQQPYGAPPPGQYGAPGGYGAQPPYPQPPQQGYGAAPQGYGPPGGHSPLPGGGYQAPPPPPRY